MLCMCVCACKHVLINNFSVKFGGGGKENTWSHFHLHPSGEKDTNFKSSLNILEVLTFNSMHLQTLYFIFVISTFWQFCTVEREREREREGRCERIVERISCALVAHSAVVTNMNDNDGGGGGDGRCPSENFPK